MEDSGNFLQAFADFVEERCSAELYSYAGYTGSAGALLLKDLDSDLRVVLRPWLRYGPVGLQDLLRSEERYRQFRKQFPARHVHIAPDFRDNARRHVGHDDTHTLIAFDPAEGTVEIIGSSNLPSALFRAALEFCEDQDINATYDFVGTLRHKGYEQGKAQADRIQPRATNPKLFISYSWDSDAHRHWVTRLAADLVRNGVSVYVDEWDLRTFGDDLHRFMEIGIRESDFVVLVCTPEYARRANERKGGVGVESTIITGEFYERNKADKFLPILRGSHSGVRRCLPTYLKSQFAIDFSKDKEYQEKLEELLRKVFGRPRYRRPPLGPVPDLPSRDI